MVRKKVYHVFLLSARILHFLSGVFFILSLALTAKVAAKAIAAAAKATAAAIEEFIGFLASGGWVALVIIAVIIIILVIIIAVIGYLDPSVALPE